MNRLAIMSSLFITLLYYPAQATTWAEQEVADPINQDEVCDVSSPMSYGSYIYQWPSKYDQIFWPKTDPNGIWFCEKSGYIAFMEDFDNLSKDDITRISQYLSENQLDNHTPKDKLKHLEALYALRELDQAKKIQLLRTFAYLNEGLENLAKANALRERALVEIENQISLELEEGQRLEYFYLAANYHRQFGHTEKSDQYIEKLLAAIDGLKDEQLSGFAKYLSELVKETPKISAGGILRPIEK